MRWKALCLYSSKQLSFLKKTYGALSNLDFIFCKGRNECSGLRWKITIGFRTVNVVQCMKYHTFCWFYLVFPFNFQTTKNKIKISPSSISLFQKFMQFWRVETQGFPTQLFLCKSDLKKCKIKSQTQKYLIFSEK